MLKQLDQFFDKLEDKIRAYLSHHPIVYAVIGGIGVILFWRGVWHLADDAKMSSLLSMIVGSIILLLSGVFVSAFIGNRLIMTGLRGEKKLAEKTEDELKTEEEELRSIENKISKIEKEISKIESKI